MNKSILNKILVTVVVLATIAVATLAYLLNNANKEKDELTQVFAEEREQLTEEYEHLYLEYDDLHSDNDSLNNLLSLHRDRIEQLTAELKTLKASNARRIKELEGELSSLRTIMRSFIVQIDSLNRTNTVLTQENRAIKTQLATARGENATLQEQNATLQQKMSIAARLEARDISIVTLKEKDRETKRLSKIVKIKTIFTLTKNVSATVGMIDVYLRLTRPDGQLLFHSKTDTFKYEDAEINFSATRQIEYGGEDTDGSIIYNVDMGELMSGTYTAELFAQGELIGATSFTL